LEKAYTFDANGNMLTDDNGTVTTSDDRTILWDVENRPKSITKDGVTTTFVYDGDGNRVKKTVGGVATVYVNKYFEKTGSDNTTNYYLGGKLIAVRTGTTLSYILQDHLGSTSGTANSSGALASTILYYSFGATRACTGTSPTDMKFTGQRLDSTGLYYYGSRYYDPGIGRFISADTIVSNPADPQSLNRYSYCLNNPLKLIDPSGHMPVGLLNIICQMYIDGAITKKQATYLIMFFNQPSIQGLNVAMHEIAAVNVAKKLSEQPGTTIVLESRIEKPSGNLLLPIGMDTTSNYEVDVIVNGSSIYEVKPKGKNFQDQVDKYTDGTGLREGAPFDEISDIPMVGKFKMGIESYVPGQASYYFYVDNQNNRVRSPEVNKEMAMEVAKWTAITLIAYFGVSTLAEIIGTATLITK
jgi:RHS repeat-associated protein